MISKPNLLLIADLTENTDSLQKMLSTHDYKVQRVNQSESFLNLAIQSNPDLILLDEDLSETNSFETCRLLKANAQTREIPIIFLAAPNEKGNVAEYFESGGADYIVKPILEAELLARITSQYALRTIQKSFEGAASGQNEANQSNASKNEINKFKFALHNSPLTIFNQDRSLRSIWFYIPNPNFDPDNVLGKTDAEILPPDDAANLMAIKRRVLKTGQPAHELVHKTVNNQSFYYELSVEPLHDEHDNIAGVRCITIDVTRRKKAEDALRKSEANLNKAQEIARLGSWTLDLQNGRITWSDEMYRIFGFEIGTTPTLESVRQHIYANDLPIYDQAFQDLESGTVLTDIEYRLKNTNDNGQRKYLISRADLVTNEAGEKTHLVGTVQDITEQKQADLILRENERLLRQIVANYPNSTVSVIEKDMTVGLIGGKDFTKRNLDPNQFIGHTIEQVFGEHAPFIKEHYQKTFAGKTTQFELKMGHEHLLFQTVPLPDEKSNINRILAVVRNETKNKQLLERNQHLNDVLLSIRNINQLIVVEKDTERLIEQACFLLTETRGYHHAWIVLVDHNQNILTVAESDQEHTPDVIQNHLRQNCHLFCKKRSIEEQKLIVIEDVQNDCTDCPLLDKFLGSGAFSIRLEHEGILYGILTVSASITHIQDGSEQLLFEELAGDLALALHGIRLEEQRQQTEAALKISEEKFRNLAENSPELVYRYRINPTPGFDYISPSATAITGFTPQEHYDDPELGFKLIHPDDRALLESTTEGSNDTLALRWVRKNGETIWTEQRNVPIYSEKGELIAIEGIARDVTKRKLAEEALKESERRLSTLMANLPGMAYRCDNSNLWTMDFVSNGCYQLTGYHDHEIQDNRKISFANLIHPDDQTAVWNKVHTAVENQRPFEIEYRIVTASGGQKIVWEKGTGVYESGELKFLEGFITDITDRKQAEEELRQLNKAMEQIPALVVITDTNGVIQYVNPKFSQVTGYSSDEIIGQSARILQSGENTQAFYNELWATIRSGKEWRGEFRNRKKNGDLYWELASIANVKNLQGRITHFVAVKEDITKQKQKDVEHVRQERLAAVGQLAAGIAHDFNNIMAIITLYSDLLRRSPQLLEKDKEKLKIIYEQAHHASNLTRQVLDFSRRSSREPRPVDLKAFVNEMIQFAERTISERIQVQFAFTQGSYMVYADPTQLHQVITNLTVNARDAMSEGGALYFQLSRSTFHDSDDLPSSDLSPGDWIKLSITDTGEGIPPDVLPHIFEPFFTTKEVGMGSGLGLAQVYGIVKQHNGTILVDSRLGEGTRFSVYFPALEDDTAVKVFDPPSNTPLGKEETILLVEDNHILLDAIQLMLESLNYRVVTAKDGTEALKIFHAQTDEIALVLTDAVMPNMDGFALASALQAREPNIKVLMMSGYSGDTISKQVPKLAGRLQKPLNLQILAKMLRDILD
ncbi:MAG: hypothetical protein DHS20C20_00420 [Ardenticatenaceae bacterium]|nr:MAG: hypothetical protein DHS20C20_00420 [Ardenticatenaceae bacterium]